MAFLLDVNVLVALMWPAHEGHLKARQWFSRYSNTGWATCPFTQAGLVRILTNPAFSPEAVSPIEAANALSTTLLHTAHQFWKDEISFAKAISPFRARLIGHRQITDAYLLGLAMHMKGKFVTRDRAVLGLLPEKERERGPVVLI
jgi:hypothetical protein